MVEKLSSISPAILKYCYCANTETANFLSLQILVLMANHQVGCLTDQSSLNFKMCANRLNL